MKELAQRVMALLWAIQDNADQIPSDIVNAAKELEEDVLEVINESESDD